MNKNLRLFLALTMFFTIFIFVFLYWLLTRQGQPLVPVDTAIVFLIAMMFGSALAGILFCILKLKLVGGLLAGMLAMVLALNRKPAHAARLGSRPLLEPRYYFKIEEHRFEMRDVSSAFTHAGVTRIAVDTDNAILTVGEPEELNKLQEYIRDRLFYGSIVSWFDAEQKVVKNARGLSATLRLSVLKLSKQFFFPPMPLLVFHLVDKAGYTEEEIAMIQALSYKVGLMDIYIWNGRVLTDEEIALGSIPDDGWVGKKPGWGKK